jgi:hypothetical protein
LTGAVQLFCTAFYGAVSLSLRCKLTSKKKKRRILIMRLLILAATATLVVGGTAMAREPVHHRHVMHHHSASAPPAEGAIPADSLGNHDAHMKNLHDSGYNPHGDLDAFGNVRQN